MNAQNLNTDDGDITDYVYISNSKCSGYCAKSWWWCIFRVQMMPDIPHVIFENGIFHHKDYLDNDNMMFQILLMDR